MEFSERVISVLLAGGLAFLSALTLGVILVSVMCRLSRRWGALDRPDGNLKCHVRPTASLGGIPLFIALLMGMGVLVPLSHRFSFGSFQVGEGVVGWLPIFIAGMFILWVGVKDDLHHVAPKTKILFQVLASMVLIGSGLIIGRLGFFGVFEISLGVLAFPVTLFWLVGSCNAFNFIDGMDGLASGIGVVIALFLAGIGIYHGAYGSALVALALAGGLASILLFNFKPAVIFLGDSGSQLVGLLLGALVIETTTTNGVFALPSAGILLSIPVLDAFLSILRRYSRAESAARGDHQHIHHCLRRQGLGVRHISAMLSAATAVCGLVAWFCLRRYGYGVAIISIAFVALELYLAIRLGCLEPNRLVQRVLGHLPVAADSKQRPMTEAGEMKAVVLTDIWERMKPLFEKMDLDRAILTLEGVNEDGRQRKKTYKWVRSVGLIASKISTEAMPHSRWTKRFPLNGGDSQIATLRLESIERAFRSSKSNRYDDQRISLLLKQISENIQTTSNQKRFQVAQADPFQLSDYFHTSQTSLEEIEELVDMS